MDTLLKNYEGLLITNAVFDTDGDEFRLYFGNGKSLVIKDNAGYCCERRFMTCDDDPDILIGTKFIGIEEKEVTCENDDYSSHQTKFVEVKGSHGSVTLVNHNVHNGYYGGFDVDIEEVDYTK